VPVPPLHERVLDAGVDRVALEHARGNDEVVEDVEDRDGDNRRDVEPQRDIEMLLAAIANHREEVDGECDPHDGDRDVDRPLELGVFFALRVAKRQRDRGRDNDRLPAPEVDLREEVERPRLQEALRRVVDRCENSVAREREDHRIRVERTKPAEREVGRRVEARQRELQRAPQADQHADRAPHHRGGDELACDRVVVANRFRGGEVRHRRRSFATRVPATTGRRHGNSRKLCVALRRQCTCCGLSVETPQDSLACELL
jgi:hypothetical protein